MYTLIEFCACACLQLWIHNIIRCIQSVGCGINCAHFSGQTNDKVHDVVFGNNAISLNYSINCSAKEHNSLVTV